MKKRIRVLRWIKYAVQDPKSDVGFRDVQVWMDSWKTDRGRICRLKSLQIKRGQIS